MSTPKWKVNAGKEELKLSPKERDWNLPGNGEIPSKRTPKKRQFLGDSSSDSSFAANEDEESFGSVEEDMDEFIDESGLLPPEVRILVEQDQLRELLDPYLRPCPRCPGKLALLFETTTIASRPFLKCTGVNCDFEGRGNPCASARLPQFDDNRTRSTDFAVNI